MTKALHILCGTFAMLIAVTPAASVPSAGPLKGLEPGEWELRERVAEGTKGEMHRLCLADLRQLIQIRHMRNNCKRLTVSEGPNRLSVNYDCGGAGGGRTDLRVETPRLVQIHSQGVAEGAPFAFAMEGRRIGACR